jgi:hypothetical protein
LTHEPDQALRSSKDFLINPQLSRKLSISLGQTAQ